MIMPGFGMVFQGQSHISGSTLDNRSIGPDKSCTWGMIHSKIYLISLDCPVPGIVLQYITELWPETPIIYFMVFCGISVLFTPC